MEELSREQIVKLALEANLGRVEIMRDIVKLERLARLIQKATMEQEENDA